MNQNFVGAPDREDVRTMEQLRRQIIPMIAVMDKLQAEMQYRIGRGESVDWPQIHKTTSLIASYINSFNILLNGGYKHTSEDVKVFRKVPKEDENGNPVINDDGTPVFVDKEVTKTSYRDVHIPAHGERVRNLHPFPIAPFPMTQPHAAGMANTLLRKRLEPMEENWVESRLQKAAEFAHVPASWGIEPKREEVKDEHAGDDGANEGAAERMPTKRVNGTLSEDDLLEMWKSAHQEAFDQGYLKAKYPSLYGGAGEGEAEGEDEDAGEDEEEEDDEEDDFEDAMDTSGAPEVATAPSGAVAAPSVPGRAARATSPTKPAMHKPIPGLPVLSLGFVHKFMTSGEATS